MITEEFSKKFANYVKKFEGEELKIYLDTVNVPTIGIGFALIIYNKKDGNWVARPLQKIQEFGIDLSAPVHEVLEKYAVAKSRNDSTANLKKQLDDLNFTITHDTAVKVLEHVTKEAYDKCVSTLGQEVWNNLGVARQVALVDHAYHSGNIVSLKNDIIAGEFKKVADTITNLPGDGGLKARYTLRAKMIEEDATEFPHTHIVEFDEHTFTQVANKCHISVAELQKLNPQIKNINKIYQGQMINVPEDFFAEHHQELNTVIGSNVEFTNTFNQYKYDSFLNIYYNNADAYEYIKGASSLGGGSHKISVPASSGDFYISLQVAHHPASFFSMYPISRKLHDSYTKPLITDIKREFPPTTVATSEHPHVSKTPPMSIRKIGLDENQYSTAFKYAQNYTIGEIAHFINQIARQDSIDFVQSVYNKAGLPNHFASLYTALELKNLNTENASKLLKEHGSKETIEDDSELPQDLSNVLPITTNEWISKLNTALYKNFTPSALLPQQSLTPQIFGVGHTNSVDMFYQSIETQRQGALMLKQLAEKGYTIDKMPPQMQETSKFINFVKFNDMVLFLNKTISITQSKYNSLLDQISDKNSDQYLKVLKSVNDEITELKNKKEQLITEMANNFDYLQEILKTNSDIGKLYNNIKMQEKAHIHEIETLLPASAANIKTAETHMIDEVTHHKHGHHHGEGHNKAKRHIDKQQIETHDHISNKDTLITDTNTLNNLDTLTLNHVPLLSNESTLNLFSTNNEPNINGTLMLANLVVRTMNPVHNETTASGTTINNGTVDSEHAHKLAYSSYAPAIEENVEDIELIGIV